MNNNLSQKLNNMDQMKFKTKIVIVIIYCAILYKCKLQLIICIKT